METDKMKRTWEKDILLGTAVGDALGFPVQFLDRATVQKEPVTGMHPWHSVWSDDTSLSLCLADSLCGGYDLQDIGNKFVDWLYEGLWTPKGEAFDIGITTDRAISRLANGYPPREAGMDRERDNGNGSLMRISPLVPAIRGFGREEQERRIAEVSSLTHRHPRSVLACIFLCGFELACMEGQALPEAFARTQRRVAELLETERFREEAPHFERLLHLDYASFKALPEQDLTLSAEMDLIIQFQVNGGHGKDILEMTGECSLDFADCGPVSVHILVSGDPSGNLHLDKRHCGKMEIFSQSLDKADHSVPEKRNTFILCIGASLVPDDPGNQSPVAFDAVQHGAVKGVVSVLLPFRIPLFHGCASMGTADDPLRDACETEHFIGKRDAGTCAFFH